MKFNLIESMKTILNHILNFILNRINEGLYYCNKYEL